MNKFGIAGALALGILSSNPALAQASASANATGSTTIIQPVTVSKTADLVFGRVVRPATGSDTVSITNASDAVTASGGSAVPIATTGVTTSRAKFTVAGEGGQTVALTIPANFTMTGTGTDIVVTLSSDKTGSQSLGGTLGTSSSINLNVGGSFTLAATQATGAYTGSFTVSAAYN
ncbi:DUF4402 domain-containing protein [Parablastomonas sp. CN1-191]|uniref:DUF4402 domain-containing protein n=1 Tax=Parablastomonas sp. CN1-191 TaxID=3400908 RepID=UPI003BF7D665